jgi:hypothetical protein
MSRNAAINTISLIGTPLASRARICGRNEFLADRGVELGPPDNERILDPNSWNWRSLIEPNL